LAPAAGESIPRLQDARSPSGTTVPGVRRRRTLPQRSCVLAREWNSRASGRAGRDARCSASTASIDLPCEYRCGASPQYAPLPHAEQHLDGELIQTLVIQAACAERRPVERVRLELLGLLRAVRAEHRADAVRIGVDLLQDGLNLLIGVPLLGLLLEDQVGAHAAPRKLLHALVALGAVGVRVEVAAAVIADILQELHEEEGALEVDRAEAEVLVVAPEGLIVEVDVEQLARVPRLRDVVQE